jgi:5-methylthioadenosine/S-adenosylhomocysteine deaminase
LLQKVSTLDPTSGDPWEVIRQATIEGAEELFERRANALESS